MAKRRRRRNKEQNATTEADSAQQQQQKAVTSSGGEQRLSVSIETDDETTTDDDKVVVVIPKAFPQDVVVSTAPNPNERVVALQKMWSSVESKKGGDTWTPTPIQLQSWSILLLESSSSSSSSASSTLPLNLIGIAPTGSGKTLAYGLSILASCSTTGGKGICGICLVPTRELAMQVEKELKVPCRALALKTIQITSIYGGRVDRDDQIQTLHKARHRPMLLAATPGRLVDLLEERSDLRKLCVDLQFLVLDEADRLAGDVDMCQQIDKIRGMLPAKNVRTCLFAATKQKSVSDKWNEWVDKPRVVIKVDTLTLFGGKKEASRTSSSEASGGESSETQNAAHMDHATASAKKRRLLSGAGAVDVARIPEHVTQILHVCSSGPDKTKELISTIATIRQTQAKQRNKSLSIVFFARIKTLQAVMKLLAKEDIQGCSEFHSQKSQVQRERTLADFRSGKSTILLATDIAARGMHVNNLEYVINYDFPDSLEQYVHRCGRAGRNQKNGKQASGTVYSFFTRDLAPMAKDVVELLRATDSWLDPNLIQLVESTNTTTTTTTTTSAAVLTQERQEKDLCPK